MFTIICSDFEKSMHIIFPNHTNICANKLPILFRRVNISKIQFYIIYNVGTLFKRFYSVNQNI